jgi:protein-disulfide isomerase
MDPELQIRPDDHVQGSARARLTLLEYGDYECPYCARAFVAIHEAQRALGPDLRFVFRNFPLTEIHPSALPAAQVAEAADLQGRFWPMHDALFTYQSDLSAETFVVLADEVGLDLDRLEQDVGSEEVLRRIQRDLRNAETLHLQGTPSLLINGRPYRGPYADGALTHVLEQLVRAGDPISP